MEVEYACVSDKGNQIDVGGVRHGLICLERNPLRCCIGRVFVDGIREQLRPVLADESLDRFGEAVGRALRESPSRLSMLNRERCLLHIPSSARLGAVPLPV